MKVQWQVRRSRCGRESCDQICDKSAAGPADSAQRRWVGKAAAGLLTVYLVAMASSVGWGDVARYALPISIGGALLLTVCPSRQPARTRAAAAEYAREPRTFTP